ncbi:MAG TPA: LysR family transcriptional regulator [Kiloniellales bacterium]|nr:LysR family transcriptional regulator [Kiloniellales bacterium]
MGRLNRDRLFVAILEEGSFVAAATRLGMSSSRASKLLSRLESELGVRLINRTTRSLSPTEAGRAYYDRLRPLLEEYDSLDLSIRNISGEPRGRLRLTAPLTFGALELAPALNDFAARFPEIELDVSFSDRAVNLVDEGFDMAVRIGRPEDSSLISRKLCDVRILLVASPDYIERHGAPAAPADLAEHECIIDTNYRDPDRWAFHVAGEEQLQPVQGRIRYSNAEASLRAAVAGLGLARLPAFVAGAALHSGEVIRLLEDFEIEPYGVHALYPHSRHLATKVRVLVDFLAERYRSTPTWEAIR